MTAKQKVARYHRADTTPVTAAEKVLENRLRRQLERWGITSRKAAPAILMISPLAGAKSAISGPIAWRG